MFDKYDPGFLAGFIGLVMTFTFTFIFRQIKIIYRFSERLKILDAKVKVSEGTDSGSFLKELLQKASDMVKEGRNVPRFHLIERYQKSKRMAKLILDINEKSSLLFEIVIHPTGRARNLAADLQMVAHVDAAEGMAAAEEQAMAHTDAVEETAAAEEQEVVHTDDTGLRQRVGTRQKIVLKVAIKTRKAREGLRRRLHMLKG